MIKKMFFLLIGFFLIFSCVLAQGTQDDPQDTVAISEPARISYVEGSAKLNAEAAEINLPIVAADELFTEDGRVEIALGKGDYIRLDKNTQLRFVEFTKDSTKIFLEKGAVYIKVHAQIVDVEAKNFSYAVKNEVVRIEADEQGSKTKSQPQKPADQFDEWNEVREQELAPTEEAQESKNLPEELQEHESTLDQNGEWREHERYGHVWIPHADYGWRPYYYGHWTWIPLLGWFWVSDESFGWCVYHHGRWQFDPMWGWYWIPVYGWAPSWVYWYSYGNYWGWCPRWHDRWYYDRYYNSYYGRGYGRGWSSFVRKDQFRDRHVPRVAARRSDLQSMSQISSAQILKKSTGPTLSQLSSTSGRNLGSIQNRQIPSRIQPSNSSQQNQISRKDSRVNIQKGETRRIQNYPPRISGRPTSTESRISSSSSQVSRFEPRTDSPRSLRSSSESRSSRQSYSPNSRFLPESRSFSAPSRSSSSSFSRSSSPRSYSSPRSFSAPSHSSAPSISRSSPSHSSGSVSRRKN